MFRIGLMTSIHAFSQKHITYRTTELLISILYQNIFKVFSTMAIEKVMKIYF